MNIKNKFNQTADGNGKQQSSVEKTKSQNNMKLLTSVDFCIVILIILTIIIVLFTVFRLYNLQTNIQSIQESMMTKSDMNDFKSIFDEQIASTNEQIRDLYDIVNNLNDNTQGAESAYISTGNGAATKTLINCVMNIMHTDTLKDEDTELWDGNTVLFEEKDGQKSLAKEVSGSKLLFTYTDANDGSEVYFYGQFSKENKWDGNCLINVYKNDKLRLITDAIYDNGRLISYKQVLSSVNASGRGIWLISKRDCDHEINIGDTWRYYSDGDIVKSFTQDSFNASDFLNVSNFKSKLNTDLEGFYHGNTSEGEYNDDSGNAYLVKFSKDGTVRMFYMGGFVDGKFSDNSGDAWEIARDEKVPGSKYLLRQGYFLKGNLDRNREYDEYFDITNDVIKEKMRNVIVIPVLKWYDSDKV